MNGVENIIEAIVVLGYFMELMWVTAVNIKPYDDFFERYMVEREKTKTYAAVGIIGLIMTIVGFVISNSYMVFYGLLSIFGLALVNWVLSKIV